MTAPERAPLGAALAVLIALICLTGSLAPALTAAVVAVCAVLVAAGWPDLLEMPSPVGSRIVIGAVGTAAAAASLITPGRLSPLNGVLIVAAAAVFASFVHEMCRRSRHALTVSLTGTVAGAMLTALGACWVLASSSATTSGRSGLLALIASALAAALLLDASPFPRPVRFLLAVLAAVIVGAALATPLAGIGMTLGALAGLGVGITAVGTHLLLGSLIVSRDPGPALAVGAGPVLSVGVVAMLAIALLR